MSKISYLRKCAEEKYESNDLDASAEIGEVLLREHWHNENYSTTGYANDLFNLACTYEEMGNLERAIELFSDSASQVYATEGEGLPYAERMANLATVLARAGATEPAFFMLLGASEIRRQYLGAQSPLYADSLYNLANTAAEMGRKADSARYHLQALKIRENEGHIEDIIHSLHSLAFLYEENSDYEKAASYAETAMQHAAGNDTAYASACNYLAMLYENCKKNEEALTLYDQVLEIASAEAGREHSACLNVALRRANLLAKLDRFHEALESYEEIREIFTRNLGTQHLFYANCLRGMAAAHKSLGNLDLAEALVLEAMKIRRIMGEDISQDLTVLMHLHLAKKEYEKAVDALVYAIMRVGGDSPQFNEMMNALALALFKSKGTGEGFLLAIELLNDREKLRPIMQKWTDWEKNEREELEESEES